MEGLDIRTLALTTLLLGLFLGVGSLVFARIHSSFYGFKALGYSYFLIAFGFILLGLRQYIPDFLSIIVANLAVVAGFSLLVLGILKFVKCEQQAFKSTATALLCAMALAFVYYTYYQTSVNARIIIISAIIVGISVYASFKVLTTQSQGALTFTHFLSFSFLYCALIFLLRIYFVYTGPPLDDFMNAGIVHAFALIALQLVAITSCFSLTISASQQLAKKLAIQATIDSLTNIYNRRAFDEFARKGVLRAQRERTPISLIIMDIDLFKEVNDSYGHQVGDKVLQEFSLRLRNSLRQYDILARYGGEEFTLLLPNTNTVTAEIIAEKLRDTIAQPVFCPEGSAELSVTASFGVATNYDKYIDWQQLISLADKALYHAKESGRNCVKLYTAEAH
ncbi:MAG: GGDEF domain-containing protein [Colwellia sp.]|nr:GGDEF domain-containing protein [Colwellia sp.]MCW8864701.1 GGDEF domain-containing protein [Colwellia sp.]MCW9081928.1 GGDEF domain-containing protein [Colwellia sp.]